MLLLIAWKFFFSVMKFAIDAMPQNLRNGHLFKKKKNTQSGQLYIEQTSSQDFLFTSRQKVIHVDVLGVIVSLLELPVTAL